MHRPIGLLLVALLISSCAETTATRVTYDDTKTEGVRFYDPLPLLVVTCQNAQLVSVPDFSRGYAVTFKAGMSKNNSDIKLTEGLLTEASANLDDSGLLSMLQSWGEKALGSAKDLAALGAQVPGTIPGMEGVWRLNFNGDGSFKDMTQIQQGKPCPTQAVVAPVPAPKSDGGPNPPAKFP
jgi:hypothetical protein